MLENGKTDFILKKSYEISYALWRIAASMPEKGFSAKIAGKAIDLIGYAADGDSQAIAAKLPGIEFLVKFGVDVNSISVANGDILAKEIGNLKSAIFDVDAQDSLDALGIAGKEYDVDISDIFSNEPHGFDAMGEGQETLIDNIDYLEAEEQKSVSKAKPANQTGNGNLKAESRQSAIIERIRQIGNCRLNDIQAILPDCSERTIRYDLESLVQKNIIERVGTGGRSVYYRLPSQ